MLHMHGFHLFICPMCRLVISCEAHKGLLSLVKDDGIVTETKPEMTII